MKKEKQRNQNGEIPSDKPSKELINPPKHSGESKAPKKDIDKSSTAKDPNLGSRNTVR